MPQSGFDPAPPLLRESAVDPEARACHGQVHSQVQLALLIKRPLQDRTDVVMLALQTV
jgi:hypothetical protein